MSVIGTGRTTRMLEEAVALSKEGRAVYVVAATMEHARMLHYMTVRPVAMDIQFESAASLGNLDWHTLRLAGAHPNCAVLIDHFAIESEFAPMLEMLHRYDTVTPKSEAVTDYWSEYYSTNGLCSLCGNTGVIDTRGTKTPAGVEVGRVNFCICPNGQALRGESK